MVTPTTLKDITGKTPDMTNTTPTQELADKGFVPVAPSTGEQKADTGIVTKPMESAVSTAPPAITFDKPKEDPSKMFIFKKGNQDVAVDSTDTAKIKDLQSQGYTSQSVPETNALEGDILSATEKQITDISNSKIAILEEKGRALDEYSKNLGEQNKAMIEEIKRSYALRKDQQDQINKGVLGGMTVRGFTSGRARYTADLQEQLLSGEESAGIARLANLDAQEKQLIMEAEKAASDKSWEVLNEKFALMLDVQDEKAQQIVELNNLAIQEQDAQIKMLEQVREDEKFELEKAKFDFTVSKDFAELTGVLPDGTPTYKATQDGLKNAIDIAGLTGEFMGAATLEERQRVTNNAYKEIELQLKDRGLNIETMSLQERINNNAVQNEIASMKYELDAQKFVLENGLNSAIDAIPEFSGLNDAFGSISLGFSDNQSKIARKEFNSLLGEGKIQQAKEFLVSSAISTLNTEQKNKAIGRSEALLALDDIESLLNKYEQKGGDTGFFSGKMEDIANKIGKTTDPELALIQNQIRLAIVDYRRAVSGAAFTESEAAEYERLFPSIGKVEEFNNSSLSSLRQTFNRNQKGVLQTVMGQTNYNNIFEDEKFNGLSQNPTSYSSLDSFLQANPDDLINIEAIERQAFSSGKELTDTEILQILEDRRENFFPEPESVTIGSLDDDGNFVPSGGIKPSFNQDLDTSLKGLGSLSEKYESGGRPEAIGYDRVGGKSYGAFQLVASNANKYVNQSAFKDEFDGLKAGTAAFDKKWQEVAKNNPEEFKKEQQAFIGKTHFTPQMDKIAKAGINLDNYSDALKDVVWSTAVQHGPATDVVVKAYDTAKKKLEREPTEEELIIQIYNERWSGGNRFASSTDQVKNSVKNRFVNERQEALNRLA